MRHIAVRYEPRTSQPVVRARAAPGEAESPFDRATHSFRWVRAGGREEPLGLWLGSLLQAEAACWGMLAVTARTRDAPISPQTAFPNHQAGLGLGLGLGLVSKGQQEQSRPPQRPSPCPV